MAAGCIDCGGAVSRGSKKGRCKPCATRRLIDDPAIAARRAERRVAFNTSRRHPRPNCADCGKEIALRSTRCRDCARAQLWTPECRERAAASTRRRHRTDPEFHEQHIARLREAMTRAKERPEFRAQRREHGRAIGLPALGRANFTPESRAKAGRSVSATRLAHVPEEYRDLYRDLTRKGHSAAERLRLVLEHAEADRRRQRRAQIEAQAVARSRHEHQPREAF